ncbi:MAG: integrin alpha, partial [Myxococcota bacterium]
VALGDVDGDGASDLLLGAVGSDGAGADAGKAYLVRGPIAGGSVAEQAHAAWLGEASLDYAGSSVALLDVDGDGADDVLVGAQGNGAGGVTGGRVYLFRSPVEAGPGALASADATITGLGPDTVAPPHGAPSVGDGLGSVVANAGDVDGDGLEDVLLGANGADDGGVDGGSAGLFFGPLADGDRAFRDADRFWYGVGDGLYVGDSVAPAGDLDDDGYDDVMIGGDAPVAGAPGPGVVWLVRGPGVAGQLDIETAETRIVGENPGDLAGAYTSAAGDTDGDGHADLLIGAYGVDLNDYNEGAAYLVHGPFAPGAVALADVRPRWVGTVDGASAGSAVAGGADLDGDALPDLLIGARYDTTGGSFAGQAYVVLP